MVHSTITSPRRSGSLLFPFVRTDDVGVQAREMVIDGVLPLVFGPLSCHRTMSASHPRAMPPPVRRSLTGASIQARSCCSSAAHPWTLYPDDAQHPVRIRLVSTLVARGLGQSMLRTEHRSHDAQARVRLRLVGAADPQLGKRR